METPVARSNAAAAGCGCRRSALRPGRWRASAPLQGSFAQAAPPHPARSWLPSPSALQVTRARPKQRHEPVKVERLRRGPCRRAAASARPLCPLEEADASTTGISVAVLGHQRRGRRLRLPVGRVPRAKSGGCSAHWSNASSTSWRARARNRAPRAGRRGSRQSACRHRGRGYGSAQHSVGDQLARVEVYSVRRVVAVRRRWAPHMIDGQSVLLAQNHEQRGGFEYRP